MRMTQRLALSVPQNRDAYHWPRGQPPAAADGTLHAGGGAICLRRPARGTPTVIGCPILPYRGGPAKRWAGAIMLHPSGECRLGVCWSAVVRMLPGGSRAHARLSLGSRRTMIRFEQGGRLKSFLCFATDDYPAKTLGQGERLESFFVPSRRTMTRFGQGKYLRGFRVFMRKLAKFFHTVSH